MLMELSITDARVLAIGGGTVGTRRIRQFVDAGAAVTVVSLQVTDDVRQMATAGTVRLSVRAFAENDLDAHPWRLVSIAITDRDQSAQMVQMAMQRNLLVVNAHGGGNAHLVAERQLGSVSVGVSTGGRSPGLARKVADRIVNDLGSDLIQEAQSDIDSLAGKPAKQPEAMEQA